MHVNHRRGETRKYVFRRRGNPYKEGWKTYWKWVSNRRNRRVLASLLRESDEAIAPFHRKGPDIVWWLD